MTTPLRLLILEDDTFDAELAVAMLEEAGFRCHWQRVETRAEFLTKLKNPQFDLILADYNLPGFDGLAALNLILEQQLDLPFILVSGALGEETAIESLKAGATDYVLKERLSRLAPVVKRALQEKEDRRKRRQAEAELRKLSQAVEQSPSLIFITNTRGRIEYVNSRFTQVTGYRPEEVIGQKPSLLKSGETSSEEYVELWRAITSGREWRGEFHNKKKDGRLYWVSASLSPIRNPAGKITHFLAIEEDITERKRVETALQQSEAYFRSLIENISDIITVLDKDGTIRFESPSVEQVLGYKPDERIAQNAFDFVHPADVEQLREIFTEGLSMPGPSPAIEIRLKHKNGLWRTFDVVGNNLLYDPVMKGLVVTSRDVTDRKRLEDQLHQAQRMEAIGQLTAGIAHDFNNLLTTINGFTELIQLDLEPENPHAEMVDKILQAGHRAADLVRQLLAFSRKQIIQPRVLDLNVIVNNMDNILRRTIGEHIDLMTFLSADLWPVKMDPTQVEQVILNLAVNARDAMPVGGKLIIETANVTLHESYIAHHFDIEPGDYVLLAVSDTGMGMSRDIQPYIFEPFFTTKDVGQGTGLGLATAYGIIKQSGGEVRVYSEKSQGTTFKIYLPKTESETSPVYAKTSVEMPSGSETILLVEDAEGVRELASDVLKMQGYTVLAAQDGQQALQLAANHKASIDMLLTDVIMPGLSGNALVIELHRSRPNLKVLYMSGYTDNAIAHHGVLESGIEFLQKPFTPMALARKVREVLDISAPLISRQ